MEEIDQQTNVQRRIDQIVELAAEGYTDKEISKILHISKHTVETHWQRLRERLGVKNRTAATIASLREKLELRNRELQEAQDALNRLYARNRESMVALLSETERKLTEVQVCEQKKSYHLSYFERASHMAGAIVYELKSFSPVVHTYVSSSAVVFNHDPQAMKEATSTFYDVISPEDLPLVYEKSLGATYPPNERYIYLYRLLMPEPRWVMDIHQAIYDANGVRTGVLGMVIEVNDLVAAGAIQPEVTRIVVPAPPILTDLPSY
ncbi:MAG: LuxR C-terminal-related transcriptional regulator [Capsulimonadales bacterium]|nr:LuxR C-terminal-related transcriptional regulator [Capsulimonadales bacterium]